MIILLGANGYMGSEFRKQLFASSLSHVALSRSFCDYTNEQTLQGVLGIYSEPVTVINCAAFVGGNQVDNCEDNKAETIQANLVFPTMLAKKCAELDVTLIHLSTGCLYNGDSAGKGWSEEDSPQLHFGTGSGVYVGCKELAEHFVRNVQPESYICRIRLPFDGFDHARNYLSKLLYYPKVVRATNSLTHRGDVVKAILELCGSNAPYGTYNMTNPGCVSSEWICSQLATQFNRYFEFWDNEEFMKTVARTPKSNCLLNTSKLSNAGIIMRPVEDAILDSIKNWVALPAQ